MHKVHIALQELLAIALILHTMAFHLPDHVIALHLENNTPKVYLCKPSGTISPAFSRLACGILNMADRHSSIHTYPS